MKSILTAVTIILSVSTVYGSTNLPGEKSETLTLLRSLSEEPLAKDATRDVPSNIDETQATCLTQSAPAPVSQPPAPASYDAMGNYTGGGVE